LHSKNSIDTHFYILLVFSVFSFFFTRFCGISGGEDASCYQQQTANDEAYSVDNGEDAALNGRQPVCANARLRSDVANGGA
jgi:hypothetical protein